MQNTNKDEPDYLDTKRVAALFGLTVSWLTKNRIYAKSEEILPFVMIGSKVLYKTKTVRAWLDARERGRAA
jgi:hypothetical protein